MSGFYGNISATTKSQFSFDRTYPNRYTMEQQMGTDGVYAGRYVLVEYDEQPDVENEVFKTFYYGKVNSKGIILYTSADTETRTEVTYTEQSSDTSSTDNVVSLNTIVKVVKDNVTDLTEASSYNFYKCTGSTTLSGATVAVFTQIDSGSYYVTNYNVDKTNYGTFETYKWRGYDSTVWQKVYSSGTEKYVQIAELNSVIPTFDITVDAPTLSPINPHFDSDSSNIYYKLHTQPAWGLRVKEASDSSISDEKTKWSSVIYNPEDGTQTTYWYTPASGTTAANWNSTTAPSADNINADIYFNKSGFEKETSIHKTGLSDTINVSASGTSKQTYYNHTTGEKDQQIDTQELSIILPSLGNVIADIWDLVYGVNSSNDNKRYRDIAWKNYNYVDGVYSQESADTSLGGMTKDLSTLAGSINAIHDLMGMIICNGGPSEEDLTEEDYNKNLIYKINDIYKYINKNDQLKSVTYPATGYTKYYDENGSLLNNNTLSEGDSVYVRDTKYYYVEMEELANGINSMYGIILEARRVLGTGYDKTRDRSTIEGAIKELNDIVDVFSDIVPNQIMIVKNNGKLHSASIITDQWIEMTVDGDANTITLEHQFTSSPDTTSSSDVNNNGNTIKLYTPQVDSMGHVIGKNVETVTLPYGYKTFTDGANNSIAAETQDTFQFNGDNWVKATISADNLTITHKDPNEVAERTVTNLTPSLGASFNIEDWRFDDKGHKAGVQTHSITLPSLSYSNNFSEISNKANVITGFEYALNGSEMKTTSQNVGTLVLTDYSAPTVGNSAKVTSSDKINDAFQKLDSHFIYTDNNLTSEITRATTAEDSINTKINNLGTLKLNTYTSTSSLDSITSSSTLSGALSTIQTRVNTLVGSDADKSIRTIANEELVAQLVPENAKESLNTLTEIATWIQNHPDDVATMNSNISSNATAISSEASTRSSADTSLSNRIAVFEDGGSHSVIDLENLVGDSTVDSRISTCLSSAKSYADELNTSIDSRVSTLESSSHSHTNKSVLDGITSTNIANWNTIPKCSADEEGTYVLKCTVSINADTLEKEYSYNWVKE